jgi:hypothetical protein
VPSARELAQISSILSSPTVPSARELVTEDINSNATVAFWGLLDTLTSLDEEIRKIWEAFRDDKLSLSAASLATSITVTLAVAFDLEFMEVFGIDGRQAAQESYQKACTMHGRKISGFAANFTLFSIAVEQAWEKFEDAINNGKTNPNAIKDINLKLFGAPGTFNGDEDVRQRMYMHLYYISTRLSQVLTILKDQTNDNHLCNILQPAMDPMTTMFAEKHLHPPMTTQVAIAFTTNPFSNIVGFLGVEAHNKPITAFDSMFEPWYKSIDKFLHDTDQAYKEVNHMDHKKMRSDVSMFVGKLKGLLKAIQNTLGVCTTVPK